MTQLACSACHLRVPRSRGVDDAVCPACAAPLELRDLRDVVGYQIWAPPELAWGAAELDAVAHAVAQALPIPGRPR